MAMSSFVAKSARAGPNWRSFAINYTRPWPPGRSMWQSSKCADFTIGWCNGCTRMNGVTRCWSSSRWDIQKLARELAQVMDVEVRCFGEQDFTQGRLRVKVCFVTREYPPNVYGGAGVHIQNLARELAQVMDVEVRCFGE